MVGFAGVPSVHDVKCAEASAAILELGGVLFPAPGRKMWGSTRRPLANVYYTCSPPGIDYKCKWLFFALLDDEWQRARMSYFWRDYTGI